MRDRKPAVVMLGGLAVAWNQRYLKAVRRCGMTALVIDRDGDTGHPLAQADELATIAPEDHAGIHDQVSAWARRFDVHGAVCLSEQYVLPAAFADWTSIPVVVKPVTPPLSRKALSRPLAATREGVLS